jgi:hypothetical protein
VRIIREEELIYPAIQAKREAVWRLQSGNNLKAIGLALHNYHDGKQGFPPGAIADKARRPEKLRAGVAASQRSPPGDLLAARSFDETLRKIHELAESGSSLR